MAIRDYDEIIRVSPKHAAALNNRALVLVTRRQFDRALQDYEEALRLDPNNASYYKNRGNAFRIIGQYERAIADYRKALSLNADEGTRKLVQSALKDLGVPG